MVLLDILQLLLNTQAAVDPQCEICPGSAFTATAASFATLGYYMQADILEHLTFTGMSRFPLLVYICGAIGGIVSMAMGSPPKMYAWFFLGPVVYMWLIGTTEIATGVRWMVANQPGDQTEVWRLAEVGLVNSRYVQRHEIEIFNNRSPIVDGDNVGIPVAYFFLMFDSLVSDTVQQMMDWTGIFSTTINNATNTATNISGGDTGVTAFDNKWYILSNLKWSFIENITSASLHNLDLRDSFMTFLSGECGERFRATIDKSKYIAASTTKGSNLPDGVLHDYDAFTQGLATQLVPIPQSLRFLLQEDGATNFRESLPPETVVNSMWLINNRDTIRCDQFLYLVLQGFRWETGQIYWNLLRKAPTGLSSGDLLFNLFYGWDLKDPQSGTKLNQNQLHGFLQDLVFVHLFRNELLYSPVFSDQRYSTSSTDLEDSARTQQRTAGSKTKYAEVYSWALMVPYLQGVLLYLLAMGYPFAAILVVMPGWHKTIFTWMSFWAWVKLWDLGFGIVIVLERSIWSILGSGSDASGLSRIILARMARFRTGPGIYIDPAQFTSGPGGGMVPIPEMRLGAYDNPQLLPLEWVALYEDVLNPALTVASRMDLDLANAYYIYIMAALYFAVPAVTGQLVLGAKSGMSGLVSNAIGGVSQDASRGAASGYTSQLTTRWGGANAVADQETYAKEMRRPVNGMGGAGLAANILSQQNEQQGLDYQGSLLGYQSDMQSMKLGAIDRKYNSYANAMGAMRLMGRQAKHAVSADPTPTSAPPTTGASAVTTGDPSTVSPGATAGKMIRGAALSTLDLGDFLMKQDFLDDSNNNSIVQADMKKAATGLSLKSKATGAANQRLQEGSEFAVQQAKWRFKRDRSEGISRTSAAMGIMAGSFGPGDLGTSVSGMSFYGQLGSEAKTAAHWAADEWLPMTETDSQNLEDGSSVGKFYFRYSLAGAAGKAEKRNLQEIGINASNLAQAGRDQLAGGRAGNEVFRRNQGGFLSSTPNEPGPLQK